MRLKQIGSFQIHDDYLGQFMESEASGSRRQA